MTQAPGRPLNVLWLIDHVCYDGSLHGGGRLFMNLIREFNSDDVQIHPYFLRASSEVHQLFIEADHPVVNLDKTKYDPTVLWTLARLCKRHDIDVMHLFCYASSTFGRVVGTALGIPAVIHDFDTQIYFPYPLYLKVLDRMLAGRTARGFAASSFCRDYMRDTRAVPEEKLEVLYHAIPEDTLISAASFDRDDARRQLGWVENGLIFGCITKLGPERGNETLLQAFRKVVDEVPDARLALIYKPTLYHRVPEEYEDIPWIRDLDAMRTQIKDQVAELGLQDNIELVEIDGSVVPYYAACDLLVAPFENERFSSVNLVEGLAFGKTFISSKIGEARELHIDHDIGVLVPTGDVDALAGALISVAENPECLNEQRQRARNAAQCFTVHAIARRFVSLYQELANEGAEPEVTCASR